MVVSESLNTFSETIITQISNRRRDCNVCQGFTVLEIAAEKKRCGSHNCTQAVLCTYHDFAGMEEETIKNAGNAFAAGMGNMEGTCGAIVGAGIVLGLATQDKAKSIKGMRQIMDKFKQRNGATQCKLLKGVGTGKVLRECPLCVADASEFLEEILEKEGVQK